MLRPLLSAAGLALLAPGAPCQNVFDHFTGTKIDERVWWTWGDHSNTTVSSSMLRLALANDAEAGLVSMAAFRGDFDFVLDFTQFQASASGNSLGVLALTVIGADGRFDKENSVVVEIAANSSTRVFRCDSTRNGQAHGRGSVAARSATGELRLRRSKTRGTVDAMYRPFGQRAWAVLKSWTDWFPDLVYVELDAHAAKGGKLSVACDKVTSLTKTVPSPFNYGQGCHGIRSRPWSVPYLGNGDFGVFVQDASNMHAKAPMLFLGGFTKLAVDLGPLGAAGCRLYASPDLLAVTAMNSESESVSYFPIPNLVSLVGGKLYLQHVVVTTKNGLGFAFANGVEATIVR